jgi:uncharacterized protein YceK
VQVAPSRAAGPTHLPVGTPSTQLPAGTFGAQIKHNPLDPWALRAKRMLDLALTAVRETLISPFS